MEKKNIIFLSHSSKLAGAERSLFDIVKGLDNGVYNKLVICPGEGPLTDLLSKKGVTFAVMPLTKCITTSVWLDRLMRTFRLFDLISRIQARRLKRTARHFKCDLIVTNTVTIKQGALAARSLALPHIWMVREHFMPGSPWSISISRSEEIVDFVVKNSTRVIFNSDLTQRSFLDLINDKKTLSLLDEKKKVIYPLTGSDLPEKHIVGESVDVEKLTRIAVVASVYTGKGQMAALRAFDHISKECPSCVLDFAGPLTERSFVGKLQKYIHEKQMRERVRFLGYIEDIPGYLDTVDILMVPSLYEPFGKTAIEGMLSKTPVIVSRNAGVCELLINGEDALIVDPDQPGEISSAIMKLINDNDLRGRLVENASLKAQRWCNNSSYSANWEDVMRETLLDRTGALFSSER